MKMNKKGFTLIELMIVVAIIGILAAIAIPKFADLINKSKEGATKGALSTVRGAIQVYYGDNEGWFPAGDAALTTDFMPKYINAMPVAKLPGTGKADSPAVAYVKTIGATGLLGATFSGTVDVGGWAYLADNTVPANWGTFLVNCSDVSVCKDIKKQADITQGSYWTAF